jgi:hypothetical protein
VKKLENELESLSGPITRENKWYSPTARYNALLEAATKLHALHSHYKDMLAVNEASVMSSGKRQGKWIEVPKSPYTAGSQFLNDLSLVKVANYRVGRSRKYPRIALYEKKCEIAALSIEEKILDMETYSDDDRKSRRIRVCIDIGIMAISYILADSNEARAFWQVLGSAAAVDILRNGYIGVKTRSIESQVQKQTVTPHHGYL